MHSFLIVSFGFSSFSRQLLCLSLSLCNALSRDFISKVPNALDQKPDVDVAVLSGVGAHFCACIDLTTLGSISDKSLSISDRGRAEEKFQQEIKFLQDMVTSIERPRKPMIAAIIGYGHAMELALTG